MDVRPARSSQIASSVGSVSHRACVRFAHWAPAVNASRCAPPMVVRGLPPLFRSRTYWSHPDAGRYLSERCWFTSAAVIASHAPVIGPATMRCQRSEEHTSEHQSLMRHSYAVFCLKKKTTQNTYNTTNKVLK